MPDEVVKSIEEMTAEEEAELQAALQEELKQDQEEVGKVILVEGPDGKQIAQKPPRKYVKPTNQQIEERTQIMMQYLIENRGAHKSVLHKAFGEIYGWHWRTTDRYVVRAQNAIRKKLEKPKQDYVTEAIAFYERQIADPEIPALLKQKAQEALRNLLGLDAPKQHRIADPDGKPLAPTVVAPVVQFVMPEKAEPKQAVVVEQNGHSNGNGTKALVEFIMPEKKQ